MYFQKRRPLSADIQIIMTMIHPWNQTHKRISQTFLFFIKSPHQKIDTPHKAGRIVKV